MCALPLPPFFICVCLFLISIVRSEADDAFPFFSIKAARQRLHNQVIDFPVATVTTRDAWEVNFWTLHVVSPVVPRLSSTLEKIRSGGIKDFENLSSKLKK
ncbi:hypothetical protein L1887_27845 [Cichorium endivia]|nr:hypothetical protein L1887_27845 [Cichorium endivia]